MFFYYVINCIKKKKKALKTKQNLQIVYFQNTFLNTVILLSFEIFKLEIMELLKLPSILLAKVSLKM